MMKCEVEVEAISLRVLRTKISQMQTRRQRFSRLARTLVYGVVYGSLFQNQRAKLSNAGNFVDKVIF